MPLEFTEYTYAKTKGGAQPPLSHGQELVTQSVAVGASSTPATAFAAGTQHIIVTKVDVDSRIKIGAPGVAATAAVGSCRFLKAGNEYAFDVLPGQVLAVIAA